MAQGAPLRILIAEDDLTSLAMLTAVLRKWGYDPVSTRDGEQALEAMQQVNAPRLLLLDWSMPKLDGLEVTRRIRALEEAEGADPPYIIILTSRGDKAHIVAGLSAGANDYMTKPYDTDELQARLRVGQRMLELQSSLIEARDALEHQAMHDSLTGVPNRRASENALSRELARAHRENVSFTIGMLDIDHFKAVNDSYGHPVGDEVLCGFVRLLERCLRGYDHLGRWGGEEFLVIAPSYRGYGALDMYERIKRAVATSGIPTQAGDLSITVSIGVAVSNGDETSDELIALADSALYRAKALGRNRVCGADEPRRVD